MKFGSGQPVRRKEDVRLVAGRGRYTDDIVLERQAYGYFCRSPHAHARIAGIDTGQAASAPGVIGILTAPDVADVPPMPVLAQPKNRDGTPLKLTPKRILPADKVRFAGEAVAMIVAETPEQAKDAAELVNVEYEALPSVTSVTRAGEGEQIWNNIPKNLALRWADGDEAQCKAVFAGAAKIVSLTVVQNRVMASPMEPRGAIGDYDPARDRYTLYTGSQGSFSIRDRIANLIGIPKENLRVVTPDVGGGFGQKTSITPEQALVLLAARKFARPIKWIGERSESFLSDAHGRDLVMMGELALDGDARIVALRASSLSNLGAYMSQIGPNVVTGGGMRILGGVYRVPVAFAEVQAFITNTAPITAYRGAGRPEVAYLMDRLLDVAAAEFGIDRVEIRRRNLPAKDEMPRKTWKGLTIDSGDFLRNLDDCVTRADWAGFPARKAQSEANGKKRGRGISYYVEVSGGPPGPEPVAIRFQPDGRVHADLGTQSNGQGHETSFAQVLASKLGLSFDAIVVREGDTELGQAGLNTVGSRSLQTAGSALLKAADSVIAKGKAAAAQLLQAGDEAAKFAVENDEGVFRVGNRAITLRELVSALQREKLPGFENGLDASGAWEGPPTFPNGCHVSEVEIDSETGKVDVVRYTVVDDVGRVVNPLLVEGQVHGGVAQGLGQALLEHAVYDDESGQLLAASLLDYALPRAADMPRIDMSSNEVPCTTNLIGSKGAGEAGTVGALPAIMSAVADALGVPHFDMPATPERVWRALNS